MVIVFIMIGNSDDKLTQAEWSAFVMRVHMAIEKHADEIHGSWVSPSAQQWQNACWCFVPAPMDRPLQDELRLLAREFRQDSIAWAEAPKTEFLS